MKSYVSSAVLALAVLTACNDYNAPSDPTPPGPVPAVFSAIGDSTAVAGKLDQFRTALGGALNAPNTPPQASGRREINWDGVPPALTNIDSFPGAFFNVNSRRGAVYTTPGTGFRVDSTDFGADNAGLAEQFSSFSTKKTFMPVGSNRVDVIFELAGTPTPGLVNGFGVIFSDVDRAGSAKVQFFDADGVLLASLDAPAQNGTKQFSFVGAVFTSSIVARVRIISGQAALSGAVTDVTAGGAADLVVMDDFIYGEPRLTPQ